MIGRTPRSSDSNLRKKWRINHFETFKGSFVTKRKRIGCFDMILGFVV